MAAPGKLRKRDVVFAVAAGAVAAGGAAILLDALKDDEPVMAIGVAREMTYEVGEFHEVSTVGPQEVIITSGDNFSIRSEGPPQALAGLEVMAVNGRLTIQPKDGRSFRRPMPSTTLHITMPRLETVSLAGSGNVSVDRIEGDHFKASIAGSGELAIAALQVDSADFSIAGAGDVRVAGAVRESRVSILGSGDVNALALRSETANVSIAGSGDVSLTVNNDARVAVMGSGDVEISGPAQCSVTRLGGGEVTCNGVEQGR